MTEAESPVLEFVGVRKVFPGVVALDGVSMEVGGGEGGEVRGVIGENGAGKSTLMKLLSGLYSPTGGEIRLGGRAVQFRGPAEAQAAGVVMIHQELNLVDELSVADNIFLGREKVRFGLVDRRGQVDESRKWLGALRCESIDPNQPCKFLSIAQKQMVEIAKALSCGARVLIMDEPTAVLTRREVEALFVVIEGLKKQGVTVLYISHLLDEVLHVCDRVTVLRDGKVVTTLGREETKAATEKELANLMVGRPMEQHFPARKACGEDVVLEVRGLRARGVGGEDGIGFTVRRGEIFGLAGLIGAGRTEVGEAIAGLRARTAGEVRVNGEVLRIRSAEDAVRAGIAYLSEDRKGTGLTLGMSVMENTTLASLGKHVVAGGWVKRGSELEATRRHVTSMRIRTSSEDRLIDTLSGGNQQKVALAKWLETGPKVLIIDEPTRGVDIGAKEQIYQLIQELTQQGMACVLISSELNEVLGMCHRIGVMRGGRLVAVLEGDAATEQDVMQHAAGAEAGVGAGAKN